MTVVFPRVTDHFIRACLSLGLVVFASPLFAQRVSERPSISTVEEVSSEDGRLSETVQIDRLDHVARLQHDAATNRAASWGHWGPNPDTYSSWTTHSNRLVPIYTFGGDLAPFKGEKSVYRSAEGLKELYGRQPEQTLNPQADYFDQTDVYRLQQQAVDAGKTRIILFIFDGMDWQTTQAAAIAKNNEVAYTSGRGTGLAFLDYAKTTTDFGSFVSSPHNDGTNVDVNGQLVTNPGGSTPGGYCVSAGGAAPWESLNAEYLIGKGDQKHAYTDSASSATSMNSGIKTYNGAINVDPSGREVLPIARTLQEDGFAVGSVSSVPISHATPACVYANNVIRSDYQDITRDMIGVPSVYHPGGLSGLDVVLGAGWGEDRAKDGAQGENYAPGNRYLSAEDAQRVDVENGGQYVVVQRTSGQNGTALLNAAASQAKQNQNRLLGFFGVTGGHLPYQTANGDYRPVVSVGNPKPDPAEVYSTADLHENPSLADMTTVALDVLNGRSNKFWLMVEAGDVDWANHSNNIDNSIGALLSGEAAFVAATEWIEQNGGWDDTLVIVTADHGHYLVLDEPAALIPSNGH